MSTINVLAAKIMLLTMMIFVAYQEVANKKISHDTLIICLIVIMCFLSLLQAVTPLKSATKKKVCSMCKGKKKVDLVGHGIGLMGETCPKCHGTGKRKGKA